jgi:hypothetical protein
MEFRYMMGLNADRQSYFAGVSLDNAAMPARAIIRPAAGPSSFGEAGANPVIPEGALVNGPDTSGVYQVRLSATGWWFIRNAIELPSHGTVLSVSVKCGHIFIFLAAAAI